MRDYGKVSSVFWTRGSGKRLRGDPEAQLVAFYLLTNPWCLSCGVYYLPIPVISHETGIPIEGASKALQRVCEAGFADYDLASEMVWVPNLPKIEIGELLRGGDKRKISLQAQLDRLDNHPFAQAFWDLYGASFGLEKPKALGSPFDGAWKPLRCQEARSKKQETRSKKQEAQKTEIGITAEQTKNFELVAPQPKTPLAPMAEPSDYKAAVDAWFIGRQEVHGDKPPWGPLQGRQMQAILKKAHSGELPALIAQFYHGPYPDSIRDGHPLSDGYSCLAKRIDMLRADLNNPQRRATAAAAAAKLRQADKAAVAGDAVQQAFKILEEREKPWLSFPKSKNS